MTASRNHLQGSLAATPLDRILDACKRHLITGVIKVTDGHRRAGRIELRAGVVDQSELEGHSGTAALIMMKEFTGEFELEQALPDLTGALGGSALAEGDFSGVSFARLMRHCEDHALTCTVTVDNDGDHVEVEYRAGEITKITHNGKPDDDVIVDVVHWTTARFRVTAPPLELDVGPTPAEKAAADKAAADKAAADKAAADKAAADKAAADKAAADKAAADKAAADKAAADKAAADKAAADKAAADKAAADKAAADKAAADKAAADKAAADKAAADKAAADKAAADKAAADKAAADRAAAEEKKKPAARDDDKKKPAAAKGDDKKKKAPSKDDAETTLEVARPKKPKSPRADQPAAAAKLAAAKSAAAKPTSAAKPAARDRATTGGNDRDLMWMVIAVVVLAAAFGAAAFLL